MFSVNKKDFCLTLNATGFMGKRWKRVEEVAGVGRRGHVWALGGRRGRRGQDGAGGDRMGRMGQEGTGGGRSGQEGTGVDREGFGRERERERDRQTKTQPGIFKINVFE